MRDCIGPKKGTQSRAENAALHPRRKASQAKRTIDSSMTNRLLMTLALSAATLAIAMNASAEVRGHDRDARVNKVRVDNSRHNVNVNRNVDVDVHGRDDYHPVATAAAVTATVGLTAAVVGSITRSLPSGCAPVLVGNVAYQQCGSTWYQPQIVGSQTQYIVVTAPR